MARSKVPTHDEMPEIVAPGQDPDSRQRLAKTLVAAGLDPNDLPDGLSVEPITDEDREEHRDMVDRHREAGQRRRDAADAQAEKAKAEAADEADKTQAAATAKDKAQNTPPEGRSGPQAAQNTAV